MGFHIFRRPQEIPSHLRRLVYTSLIISCTLPMSLIINPFHITPMVKIFTIITWIYHAVVIIKQNRQQPEEQHPAIYTYKLSLVAVYFIALGFTSGLVPVPSMILFIGNGDPFLNRDSFSRIVEIAVTIASAGVMWGIAVESTKMRKLNNMGWRTTIQEGGDSSPTLP